MDLPDILHIEAVGYGGLNGGPSGGKSRHSIPPHFLGFESFRRVLEQLPGVRRLHIGGAGDPMLHPRFFHMVRHAAQRGLEVSADSVLTGLSVERAEACVESGLRRLNVPLEPDNAVLQRNLKRLHEAKRLLESAYPRIFLAGPAMTPATGRCDRPSRALYISTSCEALPCDHARGPRRPTFGNVDKEGALKVWNREEFRAFRERLGSDQPPEVCAQCALRDSPLEFGENGVNGTGMAWKESTTPPQFARSSTTPPRPIAA